MTEQAAAIGISLSIDVGKGCNIVFQTHVPQVSEAGYLNDVLDKLQAAAERQHAKVQLAEAEFQLDHDRRIFEQITTDFAAIELREHEAREKFYEGRKVNDRRDWKRSPSEEQHRTQMLDQVARLKLQIGTVEKRIAELKAKAA